MQCIEDAVGGVINVSGPTTPLSEHLAMARTVAGHTGPLIAADNRWLVAHDVQEWAGPRSLPLWLHSPGWEGFAARSTHAAEAAGLVCRPLRQTLADVLAWEGAQGFDRARGAGLSIEEERLLIHSARER